MKYWGEQIEKNKKDINGLMERFNSSDMDLRMITQALLFSGKPLSSMLFQKTQHKQQTIEREPSTVVNEPNDDENVAYDDVAYDEYPYEDISYLDGSHDTN